jgi:hypothetical protein
MFQYRHGAQIKTCDGCFAPLHMDGIETAQVRETPHGDELTIKHYCDDTCFARDVARAAGAASVAPVT